MTAQKIIIDCDPGIDDALALVFAHGHPDLELCGITTVAGNVDLGQTTANALRVREYAGMPRGARDGGLPAPAAPARAARAGCARELRPRRGPHPARVIAGPRTGTRWTTWPRRSARNPGRSR